MPPKKSLLARSATRPTRRSARRRERLDDGIPSVYDEMLAEVVAEEQDPSSNLRSPKRRKVSEEPSSKIELDFDLFGTSEVATEEEQPDKASLEDTAPKLPQIVFDDFEGSDDSDVEFEDVNLDEAAEGEEADDDHAGANAEQKSLELDLSKPTPEPSRRAGSRRKPVGPAERKIRLEVHKAHLVCLLAHLSARNRWCESDEIQAILKPLVSRKVISLLHVDESKPQYQRSHSFMKGIEEVCAIWRQTWTITARGMQRAHWKEDADAVTASDDAEDLIDFEDFKAAARSKSGSRDLGAQLFCTLLRSVAVDTRLVCSLQVLPFSGVAKGQTPEKPKPQYYHAPPQNYTQNATITRPERKTPKKKRIVESPYPIFWVEVYSPATATWIPLDPLVRNTINKPKTGFEPPASDRLNSMSYVIAFEDDGSARDVTRRYVQWYNAKTRKQRVESTKSGEQWWSRVMDHLRKPFAEPRDEIEDASLLQRAESEPMPRNVQDFKGHPVYVLERHLRMNEVIHPKHEVGKVSTGSGKNAKLESVYRRRDVHVCRTADAWYRRGRDVVVGEQPLKRVMPKRGRLTGEMDDENDEEAASEGMALYAEYQTRLYEPPPVVDGKIPKNAYGNLDVYVPSMIPAGAVHVRHPLAAEAARVLGIDYADAVTGFVFKGRQGTAVVDGVVVPMTMCNAMINVIEGLESQATEESEQARSRVIQGLWKRWLTALRVRERVHREYGDREEDEEGGSRVVQNDDDDDDSTYEDDGFEEPGGGFMLEQEETPQGHVNQTTDWDDALPKLNLKPTDQLLPPEVVRQTVVIVRSPHKLPAPANPDHVERGRTEAADGDQGGGFIHEESEHETVTQEGGFIHEDDDAEMANQGGGFIQEDNDDAGGGGGFFSEDEMEVDDNVSAGVNVESRTQPQQAQSDHDNQSNQGQDNGDAHESPDKDMAMSSVSASADQPVSQTQRRTSAADPSTSPSQTPSPAEGRPLPNSTSTPSLHSETSLLSHDPDEEDAEPEWLLNSLGEME
ncbi:DNA repair protein rhp41 [Exophiala dermatitidis]